MTIWFLGLLSSLHDDRSIKFNTDYLSLKFFSINMWWFYNPLLRIWPAGGAPWDPGALPAPEAHPQAHSPYVRSFGFTLAILVTTEWATRVVSSGLVRDWAPEGQNSQVSQILHFWTQSFKLVITEENGLKKICLNWFYEVFEMILSGQVKQKWPGVDRNETYLRYSALKVLIMKKLLGREFSFRLL